MNSLDKRNDMRFKLHAGCVQPPSLLPGIV